MEFCVVPLLGVCEKRLSKVMLEEPNLLVVGFDAGMCTADCTVVPCAWLRVNICGLEWRNGKNRVAILQIATQT